MRRPREAPRARLPRILAAALLAAAPGAAAAQQFATDDAAVVAPRSCRLEAWHGEASTWILPACAVTPRLEVTPGIGRVRHGGERLAEYVVQGKYLLREAAPGEAGIALTLGVGLGPLAQLRADGVAGLFVNLPVTYPLPGERLVLHGNLGFHRERGGPVHLHGHDPGHAHDHGAHLALTWGTRGDLALPGGRFTLVAELFGEDRSAPAYQAGVSTVLARDRLAVDLSWGGHTGRGVRGAGWTLGAAWTPAPLF
jgi:hypothetical protein